MTRESVSALRLQQGKSQRVVDRVSKRRKGRVKGARIRPLTMFPAPTPAPLPAGEGGGGRETSEGRAVQHSGVDFARDELAIP